MKSFLTNIFPGSKLKEQTNRIAILENELTTLKASQKPRGLDPSYRSWGTGDNVIGERDAGRLSYEQLDSLYTQSSICRAIIDGICRVISCLEWNIVGTDPDKEPTKRHVKEVTEFFRNPNANDESFTQITRKIFRDIFVYDAGVIEKVKPKGGQGINEIYARDGKTFEIKIDKVGRVTGYEQKVKGISVPFKDEEIIYMMLYPKTSSIYGTPPMESLMFVLSSLMLAEVSISYYFDKDEYPPGILSFGKIGIDAYENTKAHFKARSGVVGGSKFKVAVVKDVEEVTWTPLNRPPSELQLAELMNKLWKMVFMTFGITGTEMGVIDDVNRATAFVQENIGQSRLIKPAVKMYQEYLNNEIIWTEFGYKDVQIVFDSPREDDPRLILDTIDRLVQKGILSINDARSRLGEKAIEGGDRAYIVIGNSIHFVDELGIVPQIEESEPEMEEELIEEEPTPAEDEEIEQEAVKILKSVSENGKVIDVRKSLSERKTLLKEYERIWKVSAKWFVPKLKNAYFNNRKGMNNVINQVISQLYGKMRKATDKIFRESFENGVWLAEKQDKTLKINNRKLDRKLESRIKTQNAFIKSSLLNRLKQRIKRVIDEFDKSIKKADYEEEVEFVELLESAAMTTTFNELSHYAAKTWTVSHEGWVTALEESDSPDFETAWSVRTAGDASCDGCIAQEDASPYFQKGGTWLSDSGIELEMPGDRDCYHNCLCLIEFNQEKPPKSLAGVEFTKPQSRRR